MTWKRAWALGDMKSYFKEDIDIDVDVDVDTDVDTDVNDVGDVDIDSYVGSFNGASKRV